MSLSRRRVLSFPSTRAARKIDRKTIDRLGALAIRAHRKIRAERRRLNAAAVQRTIRDTIAFLLSLDPSRERSGEMQLMARVVRDMARSHRDAAAPVAVGAKPK